MFGTCLSLAAVLRGRRTCLSALCCWRQCVGRCARRYRCAPVESGQALLSVARLRAWPGPLGPRSRRCGSVELPSLLKGLGTSLCFASQLARQGLLSTFVQLTSFIGDFDVPSQASSYCLLPSIEFLLRVPLSPKSTLDKTSLHKSTIYSRQASSFKIYSSTGQLRNLPRFTEDDTSSQGFVKSRFKIN